MSSDLVPWRCGNGACFGICPEEQFRGGAVISCCARRWDPEDAENDSPDVAGIMEGFMPSWRCSKCGRVRTWIPGKEGAGAPLEDAAGDWGGVIDKQDIASILDILVEHR